MAAHFGCEIVAGLFQRRRTLAAKFPVKTETHAGIEIVAWRTPDFWGREVW